jgi:phage shock protein PspC (stress-responsive transcriptional regulator)
MVAGVAGGIAAMLNIDPVIVRLGFLALTLLNGFGAVIYLLMWVIVPMDGSLAPTPRDQVRENVTEMRDAAEGVVQRVRSFFVTM